MTASGVVGLTWNAATSDGGSSILDYRISYHAGSDAYVILVSGIATTSYTASSLTANIIYTFKIDARNSVGYSDFSSEI